MVEDLNSVKGCPHVMDMIPQKIDLLILDGGGFTGHSEFVKLKDRTKYFILDDTESTKNDMVAKYIRNDKNFDVILDVFLDERNEWKCNDKNFNLWSPMNGFMVSKNKNI
jgi:hypothetical protein